MLPPCPLPPKIIKYPGSGGQRRVRGSPSLSPALQIPVSLDTPRRRRPVGTGTPPGQGCRQDRRRRAGGHAQGHRGEVLGKGDEDCRGDGVAVETGSRGRGGVSRWEFGCPSSLCRSCWCAGGGGVICVRDFETRSLQILLV